MQYFKPDGEFVVTCSASGGLLGIMLNLSSGFNNLVVVHSVDEFFNSIAWMGTVSTILGTIGGQVTGFFADRYIWREIMHRIGHSYFCWTANPVV